MIILLTELQPKHEERTEAHKKQMQLLAAMLSFYGKRLMEQSAMCRKVADTKKLQN